MHACSTRRVAAHRLSCSNTLAGAASVRLSEVEMDSVVADDAVVAVRAAAAAAS